MIKKLSSTLTLKGKSGKEYSFKLSTFDDFEDVKDGFTGHGLYVFQSATRMVMYIGILSSI